VAGDILICPRCLARLRRAPHLEPGMAVACPRCQTQFAAPAGTGDRRAVAGQEAGSLVYDPRHTPDRGPPQPSCTPEEDEDHPRRPARVVRTVNLHLRIVCAIHGLAILGALGAAFFEVRTILAGGPMISLLGIYVAVLGLKRSSRLAVTAGLSAVGFSLFVFLLIWGLRLGPAQASGPVCLMGSIYAAVSVPLLVCVAVAANRLPTRATPLHQQGERLAVRR